MKKNRYEIILFFVDAISMILELTASRLLSPYFGNSNFVWTSVIGIILLSSSIGNYRGGKIADKKDAKRHLKNIIYMSMIAVFIVPLIQAPILQDISQSLPIRLGAIFATMFLFFLPSLFMGYLTPIIVKLKLDNLETAGSVSGKINAIATIGGITGTFLGGFFLIPNFGTLEILFLLTIILSLLVFLIEFNIKDIKNIIISSIAIILSIVLIIVSSSSNDSNRDKVLEGVTNVKLNLDTQYGHVTIFNEENEKGLIRHLSIDGGFESATFLDEDKRYELVFEYLKHYNLMFDGNIDIKNVLLIGGAGYGYPKYFISHFDDKYLDVVEIDGDITEIAKEYFFLDDLIKDYNLNETKRLNLITADGRIYLNQNTKKYDAILNDAFAGNSPAKTLTTLEAVQHIKNSLNDNGLYLSNIISSLEGKNSRFLKAEINTLKQVFKNVYVIPCRDINDTERTQNIMVIATDDTIEFKGAYNYKLTADEIIITDDYCPVDTLVPKY